MTPFMATKGPVQVYRFQTIWEEAHWIAQKCRDLYDAGQAIALVLPTPEPSPLLRHRLLQKKMLPPSPRFTITQSLPPKGPLVILPHCHLDFQNTSPVETPYEEILQKHPSPILVTFAKMDLMGRDLYPLPVLHSLPYEAIEPPKDNPSPSKEPEGHFRFQSARALKNLETHLSGRSWSVTELEDYLQCPFYYFARHLLRLKTALIVDGDVPPPVLGQCLHTILYRFFTTARSEFVTALDQTEKKEALLQELTAQTQAVFSEMRREYPEILEGLWEQKKTRILSALKKFIKEEWRQLKEQHTYHPTHFEWGFGGPHTEKPLTLTTDEGTYSIQGRIDRIDIDVNQKRFVVIDYKTGQGVTGASIQKGKSLQIPLYIAAAQQNLDKSMEPMGGLFVNFNHLTKKDGLLKMEAAETFGLHPRSSTYTPDDVWERLFCELPQKIEGLIKNILHGHFPLRSEDDPCPPYCEFQEVCHVKERKQT